MQRASEVRILYKSARPAPQLPRDQAQMLRLQWRAPDRKMDMPGTADTSVFLSMTANFRILQLNMMKSWAGMEALINDHHSQNLDLLLIQEPPTTAYASTIWHNPLRDKLHLRLLETVQRTALIRILSAFRTVSTAALEVETYILPTHLRHKQRGQVASARLSTLSDDRPIHEVMRRAKERSTYTRTGARFPLAKTLRTMNFGRLQALETIDPKPLAPWQNQPIAEIATEPDREKAQPTRGCSNLQQVSQSSLMLQEKGIS